MCSCFDLHLPHAKIPKHFFRIVDEWDPAPLIGCVRYVLVPTAAPRTALVGSTPAEDAGTIALRWVVLASL